ncbi:hypothetical protein ACE6H2_021012 [Prunus campanulata]
MPTGPTIVLNETLLYDSTTLDSPLDSPINQDSPIQKESRPIGRKAAKAKKGSNSTNDTSKFLEQIALNGTMRIERDIKRGADEKAMYEEFAREIEYHSNKTWRRRIEKPWPWIRAICPLKQRHYGS